MSRLIWGERLLGVLNVSVGRGGRQFDDRDLEKLKGLSRRMSRVLQQSIDLEAVHTRHREWKFHSTVGEIAAKTIRYAEKFSVLARYLSELVGADTVEIFLNTPEGDWFVVGGSNRLLTPKEEPGAVSVRRLSRVVPGEPVHRALRRARGRRNPDDAGVFSGVLSDVGAVTPTAWSSWNSVSATKSRSFSSFARRSFGRYRAFSPPS